MPEFKQAAIEDEESASMFAATLLCAAVFVGVVISFIL